MGGRDKGLLPYGKGLLIEQVLEGIRPQAGSVVISANRHLERYRELGFPVVADTIGNFQGPLAGFLAGLEVMQTDYLLTLPCDGPVVASDLARRLVGGLDNAGADIAVAHDGRRLQPVYTLLHRRIEPDLRLALEQGERKVGRWLQQRGCAVVDFSDVPEQFSNINTPEDYAATVPP